MTLLWPSYQSASASSRLDFFVDDFLSASIREASLFTVILM